MGLLDIFKKSQKKEVSIPMFPQQATWSFTNTSSQKRAADYYQGWVYLCVSAIKDEIASIDLVLNKTDSNGQKTRIYNHPALDLLEFVNDFYTKHTLFEQLGAELELQGNHYWLLESSSKGVPMEIYPLDPSKVKPVIDPLQYVAHYEYTLDSKKYQIPKERIIHFKTYNPSSPIVGLSTIDSVKVSVDTDEAAKVYNRQFFANSATPGIVLEYPGTLNQETMQKLKAQWENEYQGFKKAYRTAIASGGLKVHQMEYKQSDMQFIEQRKFSRDEILALFRVPPTIAGIVETTVYASAKAAEYVFARRTISPKLRRIVDTLNEFFLPLYGDDSLSFDFISPVPRDTAEQTAYYTAGINNGFLTLNDVRRMEGLAELQNGDEVFLPFSLTPYTKPVEKAVKLDTLLKSEVSKSVKTIIKALKSDNIEDDSEDKTDPPVYGSGRWTEKEFERLGETKAKVRNSRTAGFEKLFEKTALKLFEDQKQRAIDNLKKIKSLDVALNKTRSIKLKTADILNEKKETQITIDMFAPLFKEVTGKEGEAALEYLGLDPKDFDIDAPAVQEFLKKNTAKFAGTISKTTSNQLRDLIALGLENDEGIAELTDRIVDFSGFAKARATNIARTEVLRSQGKAELVAWEQSDVVASKVWYTAADDRVCPECDLMNGTEVPLDKDFISEEDYMAMGFDVYDGAIDTAMAHPQCRCVMLPVVK